MNERILGLMFVLRAYFMRLTKAKFKKRKGRPCWSLIGSLLGYISPITYTAQNLSSWWKKSRKIFKNYREEAFLDLLLKYYEKNKDELDKECEDWLMKHLEGYQGGSL